MAEQKLAVHVAAALPSQLSGNCWHATRETPPQRNNILPAKTLVLESFSRSAASNQDN